MARNFDRQRDRFLDDGDSFGIPTVESPLKLRINQLLHSKAYFYYSIFLLAVTLLLFVWLIASKFKPTSWIFILVDGYICLSFGADVLMRIYIASPSVYFDCGRPTNLMEKLTVIFNWFDFSIVWLSGLSFCLFLVSNSDKTEEPNLNINVEILLICFRAIISILRFYGVLKAAGLSFQRLGSNTYRSFNNDSFAMNELIEKGGGQSILEDEDSGLDEDDLFAVPTMSSVSQNTKSTTPQDIKKQEVKTQDSKNKGLFGSLSGGIGTAFGLNDFEGSEDDDSGLDEDDLFKRPEMVETTQKANNNLTSSINSEGDLFKTCIQDPVLDKKKKSD